MKDLIGHDWEVFALKAQIKKVLDDIIELKEENRSISAKIKTLEKQMANNAMKLLDCDELGGFTYVCRVQRDCKTIKHLEKLKHINSILLMEYRSTISGFKSQLEWLQYKKP